jgi:hypothetical protein
MKQKLRHSMTSKIEGIHDQQTSLTNKAGGYPIPKTGMNE